jgi:hypothetical protein
MLVNQVAQVVAEEGPICFGLLCRRVVNAWGMSRVASRIEQRMLDVCARAHLKTTRTGQATFFWPQGIDPATYTAYRMSGDGPDAQRKADDLPAEEIANAALEVLRAQISLPEADLVREVARLFGYQRTGTNVEQALRNGIASLLNRGSARRENDGRIVQAG